MADITYYVAIPFLQDDNGTPVAGTAEGRTPFFATEKPKTNFT